MGSLEAWLLLRSLRTLHLRVPRQSATATALAHWLNQISNTPNGLSYDGVPGGIVTKVWHSSLQGRDPSGFEPSKQMEGGWNATFSILVGIFSNVDGISDDRFSSTSRSWQPNYHTFFITSSYAPRY